MSTQAIKALIVATSAYYGQKLDDHVVAMYAEDLADLPVDKVAAALKEIRRDPKTTRFPLPAVIRVRVMPEQNPEHEALEAVARIVAAVSNIGPYRTQDARAFIGELGWSVVQSEGGFENVCQVLNEDNIGILKAQWRQLAIAKQSRAAAGFDHAPGLPAPSGGLKSLGLSNLIKQLPQPEGEC